MRLNHQGNFEVQRFQLFEQIKKDDCAPSPTVPHLLLKTIFKLGNVIHATQTNLHMFDPFSVRKV